MSMTASEYAAALRMIADHYEANPEMQQAPSIYVFCDDREAFLKTAVALARGGRVDKSAGDPNDEYANYKATRDFGGVKLLVQIPRKQVCRLVRAAEYECPDSLLEEAKEYTAI